MYKKKLFIFFIIIFLISFSLQLLDGCKEKQPESVNITMVSGSVGKELEVLKSQISLFEETHQHIKVTLMESPESHNRKYQQYVDWLKNPGSGVDVYTIDIVWVAEFAEAGWLLPLDSYTEKHGIDLNDFLESNIKACKWNDKIVALPWFTSAGVLYYRTDLLEKYDFQVPQTWQDLEKTAIEIVKQERKENPHMVGFVFQADESEALVTNYLEYLEGEGRDVIGPSGELILDDKKALDALKIYSAMIKISAPGITVFQEEDARNYFQSGNSVFMRNWPYAMTLMSGKNSSVREKFSIAPLPGKGDNLKSKATLGGWQLAISSYSKYPSESFEVINFLTTPDQQNFKAINAGQSPTRKSCYKDKSVMASNPLMPELFDILSNTCPRPVHPRYNEISRIMQREIHLTLEGKQDGEISVKNMLEEIKRIISKKDALNEKN